MPSFILRNLDPEFWAKVRTKADAEGTTVKAVILRLLSRWLLLPVALLLVVAASASAQPADWRLASVRTVWIEVPDLASDVVPVAACFRQQMPTQTAFFTLAPSREQADAVLSFHAVDPYTFELGVLLPDRTAYYAGTPLWTGGLVMLNPNYRGADDRSCLAATTLATQLRSAMRGVRGMQ